MAALRLLRKKVFLQDAQRRPDRGVSAVSEIVKGGRVCHAQHHGYLWLLGSPPDQVRTGYLHGTRPSRKIKHKNRLTRCPFYVCSTVSDCSSGRQYNP